MLGRRGSDAVDGARALNTGARIMEESVEEADDVGSSRIMNLTPLVAVPLDWTWSANAPSGM